jgi:hypothetical protein
VSYSIRAAIFKIQNSTGVSQLFVNDQGDIGLGVTTMNAKLHIAPASATVGMLIQGAVSQTADLLQAKNSSGTVLAKIDASGSLTVASATVNGNLTVNGHIITGGSTPSITAGAAACTSPAVSVSGNDTSGLITVTTGTGCTTGGTLATLTFAAAFGVAPKVTLSPAEVNAALSMAYVNSATITTGAFELATPTSVNPINTTTYKWYYHATQ